MLKTWGSPLGRKIWKYFFLSHSFSIYLSSSQTSCNGQPTSSSLRSRHHSLLCHPSFLVTSLPTYHFKFLPLLHILKRIWFLTIFTRHDTSLFLSPQIQPLLLNILTIFSAFYVSNISCSLLVEQNHPHILRFLWFSNGKSALELWVYCFVLRTWRNCILLPKLTSTHLNKQSIHKTMCLTLSKDVIYSAALYSVFL